MTTITIDGTDHTLESLSDNARGQIASIQTVDQEIARLQSKLAITQTARNAYAIALTSDLPEKKASANKKKGIVTINGQKYSQSDLSEKAKGQIVSLRVTDEKLETLQAELAITKTARMAYAKALKDALK